jgi:hypothetical protein
MNDIAQLVKTWKELGREPDDCTPEVVRIYSSASEVKVISEKEMRLGATISTNSPDRANDTIQQDGWDFKDYMNNPVVLWAHNYDHPSIGKNLSMDVRRGPGDFQALDAETEFAPTAFARDIFSLYAGGYQRAFSVGFMPKEFEYIKDEEEHILGFDFQAHSMLEYSACPIGMNAEAVSHCLKRGLIRRSTADLFRDIDKASGGDPRVASRLLIKETVQELSVRSKISNIRAMIRRSARRN